MQFTFAKLITVVILRAQRVLERADDVISGDGEFMFEQNSASVQTMMSDKADYLEVLSF